MGGWIHLEISIQLDVNEFQVREGYREIEKLLAKRQRQSGRYRVVLQIEKKTHDSIWIIHI
jgi:hypothetical protein